MQENEGLLKSIEVLGNKIIGMENDLNYERMCKNMLTDDVERLKAEKSKLESKLGKVEAYIEQQAE